MICRFWHPVRLSWRQIRRLGGFLTASLVMVSVVTAGSLLSRPAPSPAVELRGADISFTLQEEEIGTSYSHGGQTAPLETILASHGANFVRLRVWVHPPRGTSDLTSALILARRASAAGLGLVLDLHYSDSWADRTTQQTPAAWQGKSPEELHLIVRTYTRDVIAAFHAQGTPVDILQIGNETTHGMLWPSGRIYSQWGENWTGYAGLVKAGIDGARDGSPGGMPQIMLHSDTGGDQHSSIYYFDRVLEQGIDFDLIGLSYYPFWHGSLARLQQNLHALASRYHKDIVIAETAYPWTLSSGGNVRSVVTSLEALPDAASYPPTPQGQAKFFDALTQVLLGVPNGHGAGYFIWEPGWLPGVPADASVGNTHSNLTLFDWRGRGLPALDAFRPRD